MCDELEKALEIQTEYEVDTTKGATLLAKAALKSMRKMNEMFVAHQKEAEERWRAVDDKLENLQKSFDEYRMDATKYRLIVELIKALFGTPKKSVLTLVWFGVIIGMVHIKDMLELLKMFI